MCSLDSSSQDVPLKTAYPKRSSRQDGLYRNNRSAPSLPHHLKQHEVHHQAHTKHGHRSTSTEDIKRLMHHAPTKQMRMSGMDLLIQREQEKAEAKRQKPKINPGKAKIEGLLARLPEPGAHNINFQQTLMTNSPTPSHSMHRNKREASFCSLSSNLFPPIPTHTGGPMLDYRNRAHYSMPMSHPSGYFMLQQTMGRSGSNMPLSPKQPIVINKKQQRTPI